MNPRGSCTPWILPLDMAPVHGNLLKWMHEEMGHVRPLFVPPGGSCANPTNCSAECVQFAVRRIATRAVHREMAARFGPDVFERNAYASHARRFCKTSMVGWIDEALREIQTPKLFERSWRHVKPKPDSFGHLVVRAIATHGKGNLFRKWPYDRDDENCRDDELLSYRLDRLAWPGEPRILRLLDGF